jgi:dTDP-4-dehydrorhamnose 3,5-epimerase
MIVENLPLEGLKLVRPKVLRDARGFFIESYSEPRYREAGIDCSFVQDNHARSAKGTLRGLHFQSHPGQAKLVRVASGRIFDVAVDIRPESPTFGRWSGVYLDSDDHAQLFVPIGFAHGYCVVSDAADVLYKTSAVYDARTETGFAWNDPEVGVVWPIDEPLLSERDVRAQSFAALRERLREGTR